MPDLSAEAIDALIAEARRVSGNAYAPYSRFRVSAAVLDDKDRVHVGTNVENVSYGLGCCAERSAVFAMVAAGGREVRAIAVYTPTDKPTRPCGACRQVLLEFGPDCLLVFACDGPEQFVTRLSALLPEPFRL